MTLLDHHTPQPLFAESRLLLSAGTVVKATLVERVKAAKSAGFDAISLFPQQYLHARRKENLSIVDMQDILRDHHICVDEVDPLLDLFGPTGSKSDV